MLSQFNLNSKYRAVRQIYRLHRTSMSGKPLIKASIIVVPNIQSKSFRISMQLSFQPIFRSAGFFSSIFDPTYPVDWNGIIDLHEFQQSIGNINRAIPFRRAFMICSLIFGSMILIGLCLLFVNTLGLCQGNTFGVSPINIVTIGLIAGGFILWISSALFIQSKMLTKLSRAVAAESVKYLNRTPVPCA